MFNHWPNLAHNFINASRVGEMPPCQYVSQSGLVALVMRSRTFAFACAEQSPVVPHAMLVPGPGPVPALACAIAFGPPHTLSGHWLAPVASSNCT